MDGVGKFNEALLCFKEKYALKLKKIRIRKSQVQEEWKYNVFEDRESLIANITEEIEKESSSLSGESISLIDIMIYFIMKTTKKRILCSNSRGLQINLKTWENFERL